MDLPNGPPAEETPVFTGFMLFCARRLGSSPDLMGVEDSAQLGRQLVRAWIGLSSRAKEIFEGKARELVDTSIE